MLILYVSLSNCIGLFSLLLLDDSWGADGADGAEGAEGAEGVAKDQSEDKTAEGDKTKVGDKAKAKEDQKKEDKAPAKKKINYFKWIFQNFKFYLWFYS